MTLKQALAVAENASRIAFPDCDKTQDLYGKAFGVLAREVRRQAAGARRPSWRPAPSSGTFVQSPRPEKSSQHGLWLGD